MAWINTGATVSVGQGGDTYADVYLQYDDSYTSDTVGARVYIYVRPGSSINVYFNDLTINGSNKGNILVDGSQTTLWSGTISRGSCSMSFTATWAGGPEGYSASGTVPYMTVTNITSLTDGFTFFVQAHGIPSGTRQYIEGVVSNAPFTQAGVPQKYTAVTGSWSSNITVNNSSASASGGITISPNTMYYIGALGDNGALTEFIRYNKGQYATLAEAARVLVASTTTNSVTINYSTSIDGGQYSKSIQYSIDGGTTWVTGATVATGSASMDTYTISNLTPGTTYTIQTRVTTTAGSSTGSTLTATTSAPASSVSLYGSVGGETKKVIKLYGSVNGETKLITKLYGSVNGETKLIYGGQ